MPLTLVDSPKSKRGGPSCRVHHYPIPVGYQPLADKYEKRFSTQPFSAKLVDPEDLQEALEGYATDLRFDLYSLMEVFKCSRQTLYTMLQSKEFAPIYEAAKESRADLALQRGHEVLEQTYHDALVVMRSMPLRTWQIIICHLPKLPLTATTVRAPTEILTYRLMYLSLAVLRVRNL